MAVGVPADAIVNEFIIQVFFTERGLAQTATMATPLILVGLGASAALHLRFWNIGMEGQLWCGALAATGVAIYDIGPEPIRIVLILAAGFAGGSLWIALPVFLKLRYRGQRNHHDSLDDLRGLSPRAAHAVRRLAGSGDELPRVAALRSVRNAAGAWLGDTPISGCSSRWAQARSCGC